MASLTYRLLARRLDNPLVLTALFALCGSSGGFIIGFRQASITGALTGLAAGLIVGALGGLVIGTALWFIFLVIRLDDPVPNPSFWGLPLCCENCGWHVAETGPWTRRDCLSPPTKCPTCDHGLTVYEVKCPACGGLPRTPVTLETVESLKYQHHRCSRCGCLFDRWGTAAR